MDRTFPLLVKVWNLSEMWCIIGSMSQPQTSLTMFHKKCCVPLHRDTQMFQAARRLKIKPFYSRKHLWCSLIHSHVTVQLPQLLTTILWFRIPRYPDDDTSSISPNNPEHMSAQLVSSPTLYYTLSTACCQPPKAVHLIFSPAFPLAQFSHCVEPYSTQQGRHNTCSTTFLYMNMSLPMNVPLHQRNWEFDGDRVKKSRSQGPCPRSKNFACPDWSHPMFFPPAWAVLPCHDWAWPSRSLAWPQEGNDSQHHNGHERERGRHVWKVSLLSCSTFISGELSHRLNARTSSGTSW